MRRNRHAKIVATLGPASTSRETIEEDADAAMVARRGRADSLTGSMVFLNRI